MNKSYYQDPFTIIGLGRVGRFFFLNTNSQGFTRKDDLNQLNIQLPSFVCVRISNLSDLIPKLNRLQITDTNLIFIQNGLYDHLFNNFYDKNQVTKIVLYASISDNPNHMIDGKLSVVHGPLADMMIKLFAHHHISLKKVDKIQFYHLQIEKMIWLSATSLLCSAHNTNIQGILTKHLPTLTLLCNELITAAENIDNKLIFDRHQVMTKIIQFSETLSHSHPIVPSLKEFSYRNGWFLLNCKNPTTLLPLHCQYLDNLGFGKYLTIKE